MSNERVNTGIKWVVRSAAFVILHGSLAVPAAFAQGKTRMPEPLNLRDHVEYAPSVSADGQTLIFQSDRYGLFVNAYRKVPRINAEGDQQITDDKLSTQFFGVYEARLHPSGQWLKPESIQSINRFDTSGMTPLIGGPSVSYDGNSLFFFANFPAKNGFGREDIYYCTRQKNGWGSPVNMGPTINTAGYEGFPSISADGRKLYFVRENLTLRSQNGQTCYNIMVSEKGRDGQWKRPIELPPPVNMSCEKAPRIMADSRTLVYSSIKTEGSGDFDLYMSVLQPDGSWSSPKNLRYINTKRSDQSVAISACGDLLYYISDGDIYTTPIPEELRPFKLVTVQGFVTDSLTGAPVLARVVVNDATTGQLIMTAETNPADGRYTVVLPITSEYRLTVNEKDFRAMSRRIDNSSYETCRVVPTDFRLRTVRTETTGRPSDIEITGIAASLPDPVREAALPVAATVSPVVRADTVVGSSIAPVVGPVNRSQSAESRMPTDSVQTPVPPVVTLTAAEPAPQPAMETSPSSISAVTTTAFGILEKGKSIRLNRIYFDQSSPVLRSESSAELDQLYEVLTQYPSLRIEIRGHTDNQGDFDANTQLSRDRCQSVIAYLAGKGIRKNRLRAVGRGSLDPVAPNTNEENRRKNRRVEFVLL